MGAGKASHFLGVMSGTSLDGLDLALCRFETSHSGYQYQILKATTVSYDLVWKKRLTDAAQASAEAWFKLHHECGKFIGEQCLDFLREAQVRPDYIASHGHTVFHRPELGFTTQMGCGATIAAVSGISTICDFRSMDVALGGQGAPLVPIGDALLFSDYEACLNLGGIANVSFAFHQERKAFDICFVNMALNYLCEKIGKAYDENGAIARSEPYVPELVAALLQMHETQNYPSLGREYFERKMQGLLDSPAFSIPQKLASVTEYSARRIVEVMDASLVKRCLLSGGGVYNDFLYETLQEKGQERFIKPDPATIEFKEALIFAFLGYLRVHQEINTLKSVTGSKQNSVGGAVYFR